MWAQKYDKATKMPEEVYKNVLKKKCTMIRCARSTFKYMASASGKIKQFLSEI